MARESVDIMNNGDIVSIKYNEFVTKCATVVKQDETGIMFFDTDSDFILTHDFIKRSGIEITLLDTDF
jgi:hypothetical protein